MAPLLVFDLDGTLVDSAPDLLATLTAILARHGFAADDDPVLRDGIGHGARHLIDHALHRQGVVAEREQLDAMHADFLIHYEAHICDFTRPYPGLLDLLDRFSAAGWRFAVCTNKLEGLSRKVLAELGLLERFDAVCGSDTFDHRKPDPRHLLETIALAGGTPKRALMAGDSRTDLDTARAARIPVIGVSFGYTPVPMAEMEPDLVLDAYSDLTPEIAYALLAPSGLEPARQPGAAHA
jgi:phosphoglycolate phosphatase